MKAAFIAVTLVMFLAITAFVIHLNTTQHKERPPGWLVETDGKGHYWEVQRLCNDYCIFYSNTIYTNSQDVINNEWFQCESQKAKAAEEAKKPHSEFRIDD
jgi:hypothetical protein